MDDTVSEREQSEDFHSEIEGKKIWASLPPGFRFHPTDEELVMYYLKRKLCSYNCLNLAIIAEINIYSWDPEDLPGRSVLKTRDKKWYFFHRRERKYPNGSRACRQTANGYWKITGRDRNITSNTQIVGWKKTLVFYRGRAPGGERTDWVIQEYTLDQRELENCRDADRNSYVLCKVYKKNGSGQMHPNDFGGVYKDEDWDNCENLVEDNAINQEKIVRQLNCYAALDISSVHNQSHRLTHGEEEISMDTAIINQVNADSYSGEQAIADSHFVELPKGLRNLPTSPTAIETRQICEVDKEPFIKVCSQKFPSEEQEEKALELLSFWQQEVGNPEWRPFKRITLLGKMQEAVDIDDEKLVKLKEEWGWEVYKAVVKGLTKMNEYSVNGR